MYSSLLGLLNSVYQKELRTESPFAGYTCSIACTHPNYQTNCRIQCLCSNNSYFRQMLVKRQWIWLQETFFYLIAVPKHRSSHAGHFIIAYCYSCSVLWRVIIVNLALDLIYKLSFITGVKVEGKNVQVLMLSVLGVEKAYQRSTGLPSDLFKVQSMYIKWCLEWKSNNDEGYSYNLHHYQKENSYSIL